MSEGEWIVIALVAGLVIYAAIRARSKSKSKTSGGSGGGGGGSKPPVHRK